MKDFKICFSFRTIIHTCQMKSDELSFQLEFVNGKSYIIKPKVRQSTKGYLYPINANKAYNREITTLTDFLLAIKEIQEDLHIKEWGFDRVDIAFDTTAKYDDIYKYSLYIISLFAAATGIKNAIDIQDVNTKKKRALTLKRDGYNALELQIYDKALESNNKHPYCRFEFRYKNIHNKDIYAVFEHLINLIGGITGVISSVENQRIDALYDLWQSENKSDSPTQTKAFSEFVRRYSNDIFTRNIAKGLYAKICNGNFDNWLKWFRRNSRIDFITQSRIENIVKEMKNALNVYVEKV